MHNANVLFIVAIKPCFFPFQTMFVRGENGAVLYFIDYRDTLGKGLKKYAWKNSKWQVIE